MGIFNVDFKWGFCVGILKGALNGEFKWGF